MGKHVAGAGRKVSFAKVAGTTPTTITSSRSSPLVDVVETIGQQGLSEETFVRLAALRKAIKKEGIPSPKITGSGVISGASMIKESGVRLTFGRSWERELSLQRSLQEAEDTARLTGNRGQFHWQFPTEILIEGIAKHRVKSSSENVSAWMNRVVEIGKGLGLVENPAKGSLNVRVLELKR